MFSPKIRYLTCLSTLLTRARRPADTVILASSDVTGRLAPSRRTPPPCRRNCCPPCHPALYAPPTAFPYLSLNALLSPPLTMADPPSSSSSPPPSAPPPRNTPAAGSLRRRGLSARAATFIEGTSNEWAQRRNSTLSDSISEARNSIRSSTDDLFLPRATRNDDDSNVSEESYWHSAPLVLALLPAIAGVFFRDGSSFVTDVTLLGLAAIFLNWSVRLPWYVQTPKPSSRIDANDMQGLVSLSPGDSTRKG